MAGKLSCIGHSNRRMPNPQKLQFPQSEHKQHMRRSGQRRNHNSAGIHIRIALFITLSLCLLPGCQKPPQTYGNFAGAYSVDLIQDAANALHAAYPPAKTRLVLLQPAGDAFGSELIESLRGGRYAVVEYAPPKKDGKPVSAADAGQGLGYVLDQIHDGDELRVTLHVGDETLSRLYRIQGAEGDAHHIAGFWVKREGGRHAGQ